MKTAKTFTAILVAALAAGSPAFAQSITERGPDAPEKSDGMPGASIDRDGDGSSEGRSFEGGPGGSDVTVEGRSESPSREKPDGDTGVSVGVEWDF